LIGSPSAANSATSSACAPDLLEHPDELLADRFALDLGVGDAGELREEPVLGLHVHERHVEMPSERLLDLVWLPLPVESVIDEHTGQLVADRPVNEQRGDGGVDAATQGTQHLGVADLLADPVHLLVDDVGRGPIR
jgi:hypothetical protein